MSIKLPRHLAMWEPQLRIFPPEIALALAPMVQKIASLVGHLSGKHAQGTSLPDGFAGLAKRGHYERLIASDWLLADELPDEFMRRSVMGEHLFWKMAYLEPTQARSTLTLFDAGPEQLGPPRIAHVAALAVFAARAGMSNAKFQWGILQNGEQNLLPGVNSVEVKMMLEARGVVSAQPEHFEFWSDHPANGERYGEIWVVGSERSLQLAPPNFSRLIISDVLQPGESRLRVDCRPAGKPGGAIEVELPEATLCAQLLRDPFETSAARVQKGREMVAGCLHFSASGRKLHALTRNGDVLMLPIPNSPRGMPGKAKHYAVKGAIMGVAQTRKSTWVVSVITDTPLLLYADNFGQLVFHVERLGAPTIPGTGEYHRNYVSGGATPVLPTQGNQLLPCSWYSGDHASQPGIYLLDEFGTLLRFFENPGEKKLEIVKTDVLALTRSRLGLFYAIFEQKLNQIYVAYGSMGQVFHAFQCTQKPRLAFFGCGSHEDSREFGLLAVGYTDGNWEILKPRARESLTVPPGFSVHGVVREDHYEPALIVVEDDRRTLGLLGAHGLRRLVTAASPIAAVSGSHQYPLVAYSTDAGEIAAYSLPHRKAVLQFQGGAI